MPLDHHMAVAEMTSWAEEEKTMMEWAKHVGDSLCRAYPAHLWAVGWQGGAIVVKNLAISGFYGMVLENPKDMTLKAICKDAVIKAGELLERCGMKRGAWNGECAEKLEGSDPQFFRPWSRLN